MSVPLSPCVRICVIDPKAELCIGCLRSREEIALWPGLSQEERRAIMLTLPERRGRLEAEG